MSPDGVPSFGAAYLPARDGDRGTARGMLGVLQEIVHTRSLDEVAGELERERPSVRALWARTRDTLHRERSRRIHPGLDEKTIAAWTGLMIGTFARTSHVIDDSRYLTIAEQAARFVVDRMGNLERLLRIHRDGRSEPPAFLDDYAFLAARLLDVFEAGADPIWLERVSTADFTRGQGMYGGRPSTPKRPTAPEGPNRH